VTYSCRTDYTALKSPAGTGPLPDGTYTLASATDWVQYTSDCSTSPSSLQWVIRIAGSTWEMARIVSTTGVLQVARATVTYAGSDLMLEMSCNHFVLDDGSPGWSHPQLPFEAVAGGGFRLDTGRSIPTTEWTFMQK
jgi:hypothetical protein